MSRAQKVGNMIGVALPVIAFVVAIVLLWHRAVSWLDLVVMAVLYVLTGLASRSDITGCSRTARS